MITIDDRIWTTKRGKREKKKRIELAPKDWDGREMTHKSVNAKTVKKKNKVNTFSTIERVEAVRDRARPK